MNQCEGLYTPGATDSMIYFWAVLGFLTFPLSFYLYLKFPGDIYWKISAFVIIISAAIPFPKIIIARVRVEVEETSIHMESFFFSRWTPPHDIPFDQIDKITLMSDCYTSTLQIVLLNGGVIAIFKPERSVIEKFRGAIPGKFSEEKVYKKKSFRLASALIGIVIADVVLIFIAIYLGT